MNPDQIIQWLGKLYGLPGYVLSGLLCIAVCYALRFSMRFPNEGIPVICAVLGGVFTLLLAEPAPAGMALLRWKVQNLAVGIIVGVAAWAVHNRLISKIEDRIPWLGGALDRVDNPPPSPIPQVPAPPKEAGLATFPK